MPTALHHVTVVPDHADHLIGFLADVLSLPVGARREVDGADVGPILFGTGVIHATSTIVGDAPHGLIEVLELIRDSDNHPRSRPSAEEIVLSLSFDGGNLHDVVQAANARGYDDVAGPATVRFGRHEVSVAAVRIEGVMLQLTQLL